MTFAKSTLSVILASAVVLGASPAAAQNEELDPAMVTAASRYALPIAFEGYLSACNTTLASEGYARANASRLHAKFSEGSDAAWPGAKVAMLKLAGDDAGDMSAMLEMMGDEALRPFVDSLIASMVAQEIKPDSCGDIERGLEILDPLPAENVADLIGFAVEMAQRDKADEEQAAE